MKRREILTSMSIMLYWLSIAVLSNAKEPTMPTVGHDLDPKKEAMIQNLKSLSLKASLKRLKEPVFLVNEDLLHKAIFVVFKERKKEAIVYAMDCFKLPRKEIIGDELVSRARDLYIAKKILEVFPEEAVKSLLKVYGSSDAVARGNIIRASGNLAGGQAIRSLLIKALDNKTFCEERYPEIPGEPLRLCDVAYNQLVLRYKIKNVLRTIGMVHKIEIRDHHINILKSRL